MKRCIETIDIETKGEKATHTRTIINEAFEAITKYLSNQFIEGTEPIAKPWIFMGNQIVMGKWGLHRFNTKALNKIAEKYVYCDQGRLLSVGTLFDTFTNQDKYDKVYDLLSDTESKKVFDQIIKYRIGYATIGEPASKIFPIPFDGKKNEFKEYRDSFKTSKRSKDIFELKGNHRNYLVDFFMMNSQWNEGQYSIPDKFEVKEGDVIIDAGAFVGDTALHFLDSMNGKGKIYSFEPQKINYNSLKGNVERNNLSDVISVVNKGLWSENTELYINSKEAASFLNEVNGDDRIEVETIDSFVETNHIAKIDLIKMDIEGAEMNALIGAQETIKKFRPKLALSIYHLPDDLTRIPLFIKSLVPEYKIYMAHKSHWWIETVLFATL